MSYALPAVQILLALAFFAAGLAKLLKSREGLLASRGMGWAEGFSSLQIRLIACAEIAGAVGIVVPDVSGLFPFTSVVAAACLAILMGGAVATHVRRGESFIAPLVLGGLCVVVAIARLAARV